MCRHTPLREGNDLGPHVVVAGSKVQTLLTNDVTLQEVDRTAGRLVELASLAGVGGGWGVGLGGRGRGDLILQFYREGGPQKQLGLAVSPFIHILPSPVRLFKKPNFAPRALALHTWNIHHQLF